MSESEGKVDTDTPESDDDSKITCWCGATGTADELFSDYIYSQTCGGSGYLNCQCGGDFCFCHHHGEVECYGCEDCGYDDDDYDDGYDWDCE